MMRMLIAPEKLHSLRKELLLYHYHYHYYYNYYYYETYHLPRQQQNVRNDRKGKNSIVVVVVVVDCGGGSGRLLPDRHGSLPPSSQDNSVLPKERINTPWWVRMEVPSRRNPQRMDNSLKMAIVTQCPTIPMTTTKTWMLSHP
jgi:hypothetical protein